MIRSVLPARIQPPRDLGRRILAASGYFRARTWLAARGETIPDAGLYQPLFSPWMGSPAFETLYRDVAERTLVSRDRCWILWQTARQSLRLPGDVLECGVYRGGTALLLARTIAEAAAGRRLFLFDTFQGLPDATEADRMGPGDLAETSAEAVRGLLAGFPNVAICEGLIPHTFEGLDVERIAFAHIDLDLFQSITDTLRFVYPRMVPGGMLVFDDYGFPSCPGARRAVDEFFRDRPEVPICLPTGQCLVVRLAA